MGLPDSRAESFCSPTLAGIFSERVSAEGRVGSSWICHLDLELLLRPGMNSQVGLASWRLIGRRGPGSMELGAALECECCAVY